MNRKLGFAVRLNEIPAKYLRYFKSEYPAFSSDLAEELKKVDPSRLTIYFSKSGVPAGIAVSY